MMDPNNGKKTVINNNIIEKKIYKKVVEKYLPLFYIFFLKF